MYPNPMRDHAIRRLSIRMRRLRGWLLTAAAVFTLQLVAAAFMAAQDVWHCRQSFAAGDAARDHVRGTPCMVQRHVERGPAAAATGAARATARAGAARPVPCGVPDMERADATQWPGAAAGARVAHARHGCGTVESIGRSSAAGT